MKKIFEPARLGGLELKNRLIRSSTYEFGCIENAVLLPALQTVYTDLAHGGIGLIITGMMGVNPMSSLRIAAIYGDTFSADLRGITGAVHKAGCKIVVQLGHQGAKASPLPEGASPECPSDAELPRCAPAKAMSKTSISALIKDFGKAALRCKEAGADGVQIHGAHGYLISEFLSPYFNKRTDEYGGSIENRARLLFEIYDEIRALVGAFPVLVKINYNDLVDPSITQEECVWVCSELAKRGIDAIEVSAGVGFNSKTSPCQRGFTDEGFFAAAAADIAAKVSAPIIAMGGFRTPAVIEEWLNKGNFEAVSLSRPLIREPALAKRWQSGDTSKATCVSCSKCFLSKNHGCYIDNAKT
jgi:2,4-dienoyl-CoA reductase-like NADH-dependent reductase (Old Yellow Enzyme family)